MSAVSLAPPDEACRLEVGVLKLLFDQNLSPRLVNSLAQAFPGSIHVRQVGLASANDETVWNHAREHGLLIVTKDDDFRQRSFLHGAPPKVIWVNLGNCRTSEIENLLRNQTDRISAFAADEEAALLVLVRH